MPTFLTLLFYHGHLGAILGGHSHKSGILPPGLRGLSSTLSNYMGQHAIPFR
jgi:hypothetical protein